MTNGYVVFCEICGHGWDERDPGVRYLYVDRAWTCADEADCFDRRALGTLDSPPGVIYHESAHPYVHNRADYTNTCQKCGLPRGNLAHSGGLSDGRG